MVCRSNQRKGRRNQKFFYGLKIALCETIRVWVRYEQPDERGLSRRERNEQFDQSSPEFAIPDGGEYLWIWFHEISDSLRRVADGVCFPIPWSEYLAWAKVGGHIVRVDEYAILRAVDTAFCDEMNKELQAYQEQLRAKQSAEIEAAKRGG